MGVRGRRRGWVHREGWCLRAAMVNLHVDLQQVGEIAYVLHGTLIAEVEERDLVAKKAPLQMKASLVGRGEGYEGVAATHEGDVHVSSSGRARGGGVVTREGLLGGHVATPRLRGVVGDNACLRGEAPHMGTRGERGGGRLEGRGGEKGGNPPVAHTARCIGLAAGRGRGPLPDGDALVRPAGRRLGACPMHIPADEERTPAR
eukprot:7102511-Prymnesium_polylepis.1